MKHAHLLVFFCLTLCSCLKMESKTCPSGLTCPSGMICAVNQDICIDESPSCGDAIIQASVGETCDDGNILDGDGCDSTCTSTEACGNGKKDQGEVCDDGNTKDGDRCSADCRSDERCGNNIVDIAMGEVCDFGDTDDGDGCSSDCRSTERCGNSIVDFSVGEVCDFGDTTGGDGCSADCRSGEGCGNGIHDSGEQCDDGNPDNDDNCLKVGDVCMVARCGDGYIDRQEPHVEECDDAGESATCNFNCTLQHCGDGIVNARAGEQCDPGTVGRSTNTCNSNCRTSQCGDGFTNPAAGEECDDGNRNNEDGCLNTCKANLCGNGFHNADREACDDGNRDACGLCDATCSQSHLSIATGRIEATTGSDVHDGESFSINDGKHLPVIFEFEKRDGLSNDAHIPVHISRTMTPEDVAAAIAYAINFTVPVYRYSLEVVAIHSVGQPHLTVQNKYAGGYGNQRIIKAVGSDDFKVSGMAGGKGRDCPASTQCTHNDDCAPGLRCNSGTCR